MTERFTVKSKFMLAAMMITAVAMVIMVFGYYGNPSMAADSQADKKTITVSGQAKVTAAPDIATIMLGVISENQDAKAAQQANAASMSKVLTAIRETGVKADDIKTVNYTISPKYNYDEKTGSSTIIGYSVNNSVTVTVRDLTKTGSIIDAAADSGVNVSSNISFDLSDYEKYYNEALKKAVLAAKKKAGTMADALGVKLKAAPLSVSEGGGYSPLTNYVTYGMKADAAAVVTPVQAGTLEITATVNAVYEY